MELLFKELTYKLRGCIFDVHNAVRPGFDEESYHIILEKRLKKEHIPFQSKMIGYVEHRGTRVHKFIADLVIANKIILELKNLQTDFPAASYRQILSYLKCWELELGILANFGLPKATIKRVIYTEKEPQVVEDYGHIKKHITVANRNLLRSIREAILTIHKFHGIGYGELVYQAILNEELSYKKIPFSPINMIPIKYEGEIIRMYEMKFPIIDNQILCGVVALKDNINYDIANIQTYLNSLGLPIGLLAHFGKEKLEIIGISSS